MTRFSLSILQKLVVGFAALTTLGCGASPDHAEFYAHLDDEGKQLLSNQSSTGQIRQADLLVANNQFLLGKLYAKKYNTHDKSVFWFRLAAEQGHSEAQFNLSTAYLEGFGGLRTDPKLRFKWLKESANNQYPVALYFLGIAYLDDPDLESNPPEAFNQLLKAHELGHKDAHKSLGRAAWLVVKSELTESDFQELQKILRDSSPLIPTRLAQLGKKIEAEQMQLELAFAIRGDFQYKMTEFLEILTLAQFGLRNSTRAKYCLDMRSAYLMRYSRGAVAIEGLLRHYSEANKLERGAIDNKYLEPLIHYNEAIDRRHAMTAAQDRMTKRIDGFSSIDEETPFLPSPPFSLLSQASFEQLEAVIAESIMQLAEKDPSGAKLFLLRFRDDENNPEASREMAAAVLQALQQLGK